MQFELTVVLSHVLLQSESWRSDKIHITRGVCHLPVSVTPPAWVCDRGELLCTPWIPTLLTSLCLFAVGLCDTGSGISMTIPDAGVGHCLKENNEK